MQNANLYVAPRWDASQQKHTLDVAMKGISEYESEIFTHEKAKRSDAPPMYRRSTTEIIGKAIFGLVAILFVINCVLFFATL